MLTSTGTFGESATMTLALPLTVYWRAITHTPRKARDCACHEAGKNLVIIVNLLQ